MSDKKQLTMTRAKLKRMCQDYMLRGCALAAMGFAEELNLDADTILACVERTNRYDYADREGLVKLNRMLEIFCESKGLEGFRFL